MTAKKKTTKPKVTNDVIETLIAVDPISTHDTDKATTLIERIASCEFYQQPSVTELVEIMECDGIEDDHYVYKVTFTKVGKVARSKVSFTKEG